MLNLALTSDALWLQLRAGWCSGGQIPLWKRVGGPWRPRPYHALSPPLQGCVIKNAEAQCSLPEADEWCRPRGYPIPRGWGGGGGAKWLSLRHHSAWRELRKMAKYTTVFFPPLSLERLAVWSSSGGSAASSCCVFLSPVEQVNGLTREEGKRWRSAYLGRYKQGF